MASIVSTRYELHQPCTNTAKVTQLILLSLALVVTVLRCWIRLRVERRGLTPTDYLVWGGWVCTAGWVACSIRSLNIEKHHPLAEDTTSDSVEYLKVCKMQITFCIAVSKIRTITGILANTRFTFRLCSYRATSSTWASISQRLPS